MQQKLLVSTEHRRMHSYPPLLWGEVCIHPMLAYDTQLKALTPVLLLTLAKSARILQQLRHGLWNKHQQVKKGPS